MIEVPVRYKREVVAVAFLDPDQGTLASRRWTLTAQGYAVAGGDLMHRAVAGLVKGDGLYVDHINRDKLDNRRENLRVGTQALNCQNLPSQRGTSRYRGVSWDKAKGKWAACVMLDRRTRHLGRFDSEVEAAVAARRFRREHMPFAVEHPDPILDRLEREFR